MKGSGSLWIVDYLKNRCKYSILKFSLGVASVMIGELHSLG